MTNPFYVQPAAAGLGQAFSPVAQAWSQKNQEQTQADKLAAQQGIYGGYMDALYSGDYDAQRQIERDNPILMQQLSTIRQGQESRLGGIEADMANDVLLGNMTGEELSTKYGTQLQGMGQGQLAGQLSSLRPEQLKALAIQNADPESYKRFRDITPKPKEFAQATGKGMEGWKFDKSTGSYSLDPNYAKFLQSDAAKLASKDMLPLRTYQALTTKLRR